MIELILFRLLFILSPSQLTYFFWGSWSYIGGQRIDYLAIAITFPEILIIALLLFRLAKKKDLLLTLNFKKHSLTFILLLFLVSSNIFFAFNPLLTTFKWARVVLYLMFSIYLYTLPQKTLKEIPTLLFFGLVWSSLLGVFQFFKNSSIDGMFYFLGERRIRAFYTGVATTSLLGKEIIRTYSSFPHPNVFAGFTLGAYLISKLHGVSRKIFFLIPLIFFLTRSAHILVSLIMSFIPFRKSFPLSFILPSFLLISFLVYFSLHSISFLDTKGVAERLALLKSGVSGFATSPLFGVGLGGSLYFSPRALIQPIHNVFILLLAELGVSGLIIVTFLVRNLNVKKSALFFAFLGLGIFDHYLLTLPQGLFITAVALSVFVEKKH